MLHRWADLIEEHADELALIETRDMGMAIGDARWCAGNAAAVMRYYAGAVDKFFGATIPVDRDGIVLTFREPVGVVAAIIPFGTRRCSCSPRRRRPRAGHWLHGGGEAVEYAASAILRLTEIPFEEVGLPPPGVLDVVPGPGRHDW